MSTEPYNAWLAERCKDGRDEYLTMDSSGLFAWIADADRAIHCCRRKDIERLTECYEGFDMRITEHQFG